LKRKCPAIALENPLHERSAFAGSKFLRKCPVNKPKIRYSKPVNTAIQAA
jgi:hypothetical protein